MVGFHNNSIYEEMSARHQNSYHSKVSVSSLCFELVVPIKQWENDTNQTCNILSTSCRCKRTITERSVKAKVFILRRLGSRQLLGAFYVPFAYLGSWTKSKKFASEIGAGTCFTFSALDKKFRFPTTCGKWLGFFFFYIGCSWSSAFCHRFRVKNSHRQWRKLCSSFSQSLKKSSVHNLQSWR